MEPIPEDDMNNSSLTIDCNQQNNDGDADRHCDNDDASPQQQSESKSVRREIYRSEKVESSKRFLWFFRLNHGRFSFLPEKSISVRF